MYDFQQKKAYKYIKNIYPKRKYKFRKMNLLEKEDTG